MERVVEVRKVGIRGRLILSELAAGAVIACTIPPYLIFTTNLSGPEISLYFQLAIVVAVGWVISSYFSVTALSAPTIAFLRAIDEERRSGETTLSEEAIKAGRVAVLNLPIRHALNVLARSNAIGIFISTVMFVTGTLSLQRVIALETRAVVYLFLSTTFMFFICERILRPVRQTVALRCRRLNGLDDNGIVRFGVQARLMVFVLVMVGAPLAMMDSIYGRLLADNGSGSAPLALHTMAYAITPFAIGVAAVMALLLAQSITEPLTRTARLMKEIGDGNLSLRVDVMTSDETGLLGESFNRMVDQLEESQNRLKAANEEIRSLNQDLERRVEERTRQWQEAADRNRVILNSIGDGIIVFDSRRRAAMANPAVKEVLGLNPNEVLGQTVDSIVARDGTMEDRDRSLAILAGLLTTTGRHHGAPVIVKFKLRNKVLATSFAPITTSAGDLTGGLVAVFRDMTELENVTADLARANLELVQASRHKSEFLANMSHELRTR